MAAFRTLHTIKQQREMLESTAAAVLQHDWSQRGNGSSKIRDRNGEVLGSAGGCGYDRFGSALGGVIEHLFPAELHKLAKRTRNAKTAPRRSYQASQKFYGLFYNAETDAAWVDGACGSECMVKILNAIGYDLEHVGSSATGQTGTTFYKLVPVPRRLLAHL